MLFVLPTQVYFNHGNLKLIRRTLLCCKLSRDKTDWPYSLDTFECRNRFRDITAL